MRVCHRGVQAAGCTGCTYLCTGGEAYIQGGIPPYIHQEGITSLLASPRGINLLRCTPGWVIPSKVYPGWVSLSFYASQGEYLSPLCLPGWLFSPKVYPRVCNLCVHTSGCVTSAYIPQGVLFPSRVYPEVCYSIPGIP